jgi:hypothetical protein
MSRHTMRGVAKIQTRAGALARDCLITDISDGGVRLYAEDGEIADRFTLWLTGGVRRECRVAWRLGHEVGAEFTDNAQGGFARRLAG